MLGGTQGRPAFTQKRKHDNLMKDLMLTLKQYELFRAAFMGGFTHANAEWVKTKHCIKDVGSYDFNSDYPAVMCLEKFPMTPFVEPPGGIASEHDFRHYINNYACIFVLELWDVVPKLYNEHYIPSSKCFVLEGAVEDNGRVAFAKHLMLTLTELDFLIIDDFYYYKRRAVSNFVISEKGYLPARYIRAILNLYENKTKLKGIIGKEIEYLTSKAMVNASYGNMAMDPIRDSFEYVNNEYVDTTDTRESAIEKYNNSRNRFLAYQWGVYVTAYARFNLFQTIKLLGNDYVYSDTDSIKLINVDSNKHLFDDWNRQVQEKIDKASKILNIPKEKFIPTDSKGNKHILGVWEYEGMYDEFKSIGAKRYMIHVINITPKHFELVAARQGVIIMNGPFKGYWSLTVAGANKYSAMFYIAHLAIITGKSPFDLFNENLVIPAGYSGRLDVTYIDDETHGLMFDINGKAYEYHELSSVNMTPTDYEFNLSQKYINYLFNIEEGMYV